MRWPWGGKTEKRQAGGAYTDAIVSLLQARAGGVSVGEPNAIAALEIAAGMWSRGFASAEVSPAIPAVTPSFLASVGRSLVRTGQSLWAIDVSHGEIVLTPAASWDVAGSADPESWVFRLDLAGPSGGETRLYPSAAVLNFRYAPEPERPWSSPSPLGYARATARLAANLELRLGEEASASVGSLLPVPSDGGDGDVDDPLASLKADLKNLQGATALVETTSAGFGEGRAAAPQADWQVKRLGANPPQTLNELRGAAGGDVLAACGVPHGIGGWPITRCVARERHGAASAWERYNLRQGWLVKKWLSS